MHGRSGVCSCERLRILLDACHSGRFSQELVAQNGALADRLMRDGRAGALVLAAAKGRQSAYEGEVRRDPNSTAPIAGKPNPHGLFTGAILDALADRATDRDHDGNVQMCELIDATITRVTDLTKGKQTPWVVRREAFGDSVVTIAAK